MEKLKPLCTIGVYVKCCGHYEKQLAVPQKPIELYGIATLLLGVYPREMRVLKRYLYTYIYSSIFHNIQKVEAIQVSIHK